MSAQQPKALRLAKYLESFFISEEVDASMARKIAAELRRLHKENADFRATIDHLTRENAGQLGEIVELKEQRDELLEALRWYVETDEVSEIAGNEFWLEGRDRARAAIAKAGGAT